MDTHSDYSSDDENSSKKPKYVSTVTVTVEPLSAATSE